MSNPFADPESLLRYGLRVKDVKERVSPRAPLRQPTASSSPASPASSVVVTGFSLEKIAQGYRMHNVAHLGKAYDMDWSGTLLPGDGQGSPSYHKQDVWLSDASYRTINNVVFDIPSGPEYGSTIVALYRHRNTKDTNQQKLLAEFKSVLAEDFVEYWMITSTRTTYMKKGDDVVEHCRKRTQGRYTSQGAIAGGSLQLNASLSLETKTWLDIDNPQEFMDATQWLTGKNTTWLYRCTKEKKDFERALVLGVGNDDRFGINANDYVSNDRPARGVAVREKFSP